MSKVKLAEGGFLLCAAMFGFMFMMSCLFAEVQAPQTQAFISKEKESIQQLEAKVKSICRRENPKIFQTLK